MRARALILALVLALAAAACAESGTGDRVADTGPDVVPSQSTEAGQSPFPVTIEHRFGVTVIEKRPERVLSLGFQEHDAIFALGVTPVAVRYWFGDESDVIFPWAEDEARGAQPEILQMTFGELNFERIAALQPDLIMGVYSGITAEEYETLSQIAPTVAQTEDYVDFGVPWQDMIRTVGRALGRSERAEELVAEVEAQFAAARSVHPGFEGLTVVVATYGADDIGFFASEDPRSRFFTSLGFSVPGRFDDLADGRFFGTLSREQTEPLETDLVVWDQMAYVDGGRATIESDPLISGLEVMTGGRAVYLEGELEDAFAFNTVLSLPFLLDELVPRLATLVEG